jgi:hypothetical protein
MEKLQRRAKSVASIRQRGDVMLYLGHLRADKKCQAVIIGLVGNTPFERLKEVCAASERLRLPPDTAQYQVMRGTSMLRMQPVSKWGRIPSRAAFPVFYKEILP